MDFDLAFVATQNGSNDILYLLGIIIAVPATIVGAHLVTDLLEDFFARRLHPAAVAGIFLALLASILGIGAATFDREITSDHHDAITRRTQAWHAQAGDLYAAAAKTMPVIGTGPAGNASQAWFTTVDVSGHPVECTATRTDATWRGATATITCEGKPAPASTSIGKPVDWIDGWKVWDDTDVVTKTLAWYGWAVDGPITKEHLVLGGTWSDGRPTVTFAATAPDGTEHKTCQLTGRGYLTCDGTLQRLDRA